MWCTRSLQGYASTPRKLPTFAFGREPSTGSVNEGTLTFQSRILSLQSSSLFVRKEELSAPFVIYQSCKLETGSSLTQYGQWKTRASSHLLLLGKILWQIKMRCFVTKLECLGSRFHDQNPLECKHHHLSL